MHWHIETVDNAVPVSGLKAALEAQRDEWVKTTPQVSHDLTDKDQMFFQAKNEARQATVRDRAKAIAEKNAAGLDDTHANIIRQMNDGIESAVLLAGKWGKDTLVRCRISGLYKPKNKREAGVDERINVMLDQALLG